MYTAEQLELPERLELADVVSEANRLLGLSPELADSGEFSERTVAYYVQKKLLPRRAHRGPGTTYPPSYVYRLLFIRMLQQRGLSLDDIRAGYLADTMGKVSDDTVRNVLLGEPLEVIAVAESPEGFAFEDGDCYSESPLPSEWYAPDPSPEPRNTRLALPRDAAPMGPASERRRSKMAGYAQPERTAVSLKKPFPERRYPLGPDADLIVRRDSLSPAQERRLQHIAKLLADILNDPD